MACSTLGAAIVTAIVVDFIPVLLRGFLVDLWIAVATAGIGLAVELPIALLRLKVAWIRPALRIVIRPLQAAPVYVVMFFLLSMLPDEVVILGRPMMIGGVTVMILAQCTFMIPYVAEAGFDALGRLAAGERDQALLFLPNLLRGFNVVIMSSGFGAAIGVAEAVGVTAREAEMLEHMSERVVLFLIAIALFVSFFSAANLLVQRLVRLSR